MNVLIQVGLRVFLSWLVAPLPLLPASGLVARANLCYFRFQCRQVLLHHTRRRCREGGTAKELNRGAELPDAVGRNDSRPALPTLQALQSLTRLLLLSAPRHPAAAVLQDGSAAQPGGRDSARVGRNSFVRELGEEAWRPAGMTRVRCTPVFPTTCSSL